MTVLALFLLLLVLPQSTPALRMKADLQALTTREMNGRVALQPGAKLAADFIASEFQKAGLQPCCSGSFLQEFSLVEYTGDAAASSITYNGERLDFTGAFKQSVDLRAPLVFAGYGITAPEYRYDDYRGIDAKGKIVVVLEREPQEADPKSPFHGAGQTTHLAPRVKRLNAQAHGAVALLVMPSPKSTTAPTNADRTPLRGASPAMLDEQVRIPMLTLSRASASRLVPDYEQRQEEIDRTLRPVSRPLAGEAEIRLRTGNARSGVTWNVIGVLPGESSDTVLLTSHYDHLPQRGDQYYPGANDNGSGTVAVLELARQFAASRTRPKRTLVFISFGAEEEGLLGSYHYVTRPTFPLRGTRAVINLDMMGRDEAHTPQTEGHVAVPANTHNHLNVIGGTYFPKLLQEIRQANAAVGLQLDEKYDRDSSQNALYRCDHFPFMIAGVPAVWFFGGWHPGYHEPSDTVETINWEKMEKVVRLAYLTAERLAR